MKKLILYSLFVFLSSFIFAQSDTIRKVPKFKIKNKTENIIEIPMKVDIQIKKFAEDNYPTNIKMQEYVYKQQVEAYVYMKNVTDLEIKQISETECPDDYVMQKYTYDSLISTKNSQK